MAQALTAALIDLGPPAVTDWSVAPAQAKVDGDDALLDRVCGMSPPAMVQRIWTNIPCLVATRSQARMPGFAQARRACDLPVAVRRSAGTTVLHHWGTMQLSIAMVRQDPGIEEGYRVLTGLLVGALARLRVEAIPARASGSYCDGRYNILVDGRKLAGTAAFMVPRGGRTATVAHAVIAIAGDPREDVRRIIAFERALGLHPAYRADAHCTLENAVRTRQRQQCTGLTYSADQQIL